MTRLTEGLTRAILHDNADVDDAGRFLDKPLNEGLDGAPRSVLLDCVSLLSPLLVLARALFAFASPAGVAAGVARSPVVLVGRRPAWKPPCTPEALPFASADASTFPDASGRVRENQQFDARCKSAKTTSHTHLMRRLQSRHGARTWIQSSHASDWRGPSDSGSFWTIWIYGYHWISLRCAG